MRYQLEAFLVLVKVDNRGGCKAKKANEEDTEAEDVGGLVRGAGHRGGHDWREGRGGRAHG